jgi:hypothetical protein
VNWDAWTGIGTIALAVMTLAAVVTSILLARQDRRRFEDERRHAREQEQLEEAWAVHADMAQTVYHGQNAEPARILWATISNRGRFTITRLEARFSMDGRAVIMPEKSERDMSADYNGQLGMGLLREEGAMSGILRGWGETMRFQSEVLPTAQLKDPYALVRWTDRWGTRWEHRLGGVHRVGSDEVWKP